MKGAENPVFTQRVNCIRDKVRQKLDKIEFMSNEDQHNRNYRWISLKILQVITHQTAVHHAIQTFYNDDHAYCIQSFQNYEHENVCGVIDDLIKLDLSWDLFKSLAFVMPFLFLVYLLADI